MRNKIAKISLFIALLQAQGLAHAFVTLTAINSAIACNASMDRKFWIAELTATYGAPLRNEGGALWFKGQGELYGSTVKEFFVSSKPGYQFIGAVLATTPDKLVEPIQTSRSFPTNLFQTPSDGWVGANAMHLKWHQQKFSKILCIGFGKYIAGVDQ
ncbi:hypothetical protein UFOVP116_312 [uncultured Caudovirales phage]|uniref:Uncharacterized protein n=1 Tax=uncultured Caudovirales phage TaxID=2100421 RepID=A0A6J5L845_9CAUD|nr:hypothetical protein UFOVP116_312 [uncultured Caudovirales phage]